MNEADLIQIIRQAADEGRVKLELQNRAITSLPEELGLLKGLKELHLLGNALVEIPSAIAELKELQVLSLARNRLEQLPPQIGELPNLRELYLDRNSLTSLPDTIGQLVNLDSLLLNDNQLSTLPESFAKMRSLRWVTLAQNRLKALPSVKAGELSKLRTLYLDTNALISLPDEIGQLVNLEELFLDRNQLGSLPESFADMRSLRMVRLDDNQFNEFPLQLCRLPRLEQLSLSGNKLTALPGEVGAMRSLQKLHVARMRITKLPTELGRLEELKELEFDSSVLEFPPRNVAEQGPRGIIDFLRGRVSEVAPQPTSRKDSEFEVYISYAHEDREFAKKLGSALRARTRRVFFDLDLYGGDVWPDELRKAYESAAILLFIISPNSLESRYARRELSQASADKKPILPILYRTINVLPPELEKIFHISVEEAGSFESLLGKVESAINRLIATGAARHGELFSLDEVATLKLSSTLKRVMSAAAQITRGAPITSTMLVFGLVDQTAAGDRTSATFLSEYISQRFGEKFQQLRNRYQEYFSQHYGSLPQGKVTANLKAIFEQAEAVHSKVSSRNDSVGARHLVAALLTYPPKQSQPGALKFLSELQVDLENLRDTFLDLMVNKAFHEEAQAWRQLLGKPQKRGPLIPRFNDDLAAGTDCMNIERDVNAMANLIASKTLQPPLAIGLFGQWGSGKSFFMNKLEGAVRGFAELARKDEKRGGDYWPNIVQIQFNAWHYVDANLWANLVAHIFEELNRWGKDAASPIQQAKESALKNLEVAKEAQAAAEARLEQAKKAVTAAEATRKERLNEVNSNKKKLAQAIAIDIWEQVRESVQLDQNTKEQLQQVGMEVDDIQKSAEQVYAHLTELGTLTGRTKAIWLSMCKGYGGWTASMIGGAILGLGVLGAGAVAKWFSEGAGIVVGFTGPVVALVVGAANWMKKNVDLVSGAVKPLPEGVRKGEGGKDCCD
jgi:Leucine-rich repeat (LRR) protein